MKVLFLRRLQDSAVQYNKSETSKLHNSWQVLFFALITVAIYSLKAGDVVAKNLSWGKSLLLFPPLNYRRRLWWQWFSALCVGVTSRRRRDLFGRGLKLVKRASLNGCKWKSVSLAQSEICDLMASEVKLHLHVHYPPPQSFEDKFWATFAITC